MKEVLLSSAVDCQLIYRLFPSINSTILARYLRNPDAFRSN